MNNSFKFSFRIGRSVYKYDNMIAVNRITNSFLIISYNKFRQPIPASSTDSKIAACSRSMFS